MSIPVFNCKNADDVMKAVKDYDISFIQYWFVDILGTLKSFQITPNELEASFEEGMGFDASSILGFCRIDESDMVAMPDPTTFQVCSWRPSERPVARMFCDVVSPDGTLSEINRNLIENNVQVADSAEAAAENAHAIAILTEWDEFMAYDWDSIHSSMLKPAFLFDGRRILDSVDMKNKGFHYYKIGQS